LMRLENELFIYFFVSYIDILGENFGCSEKGTKFEIFFHFQFDVMQ
jgi:hypothetical protein